MKAVSRNHKDSRATCLCLPATHTFLPPPPQRANFRHARQKRDGSAQLELGSAHGGLVYIVTRRLLQGRGASPASTGQAVTLHVVGPAAAPTFVSGHTTAKDWDEQLTLAATHAIPWGELIGGGITFSAPVTVLQKVEEPQRVLDLWDRLVCACQDLVGRAGSQLRYQSQRVVADVPAVSRRHDGYPLVATEATVAACLTRSTRGRACRAIWRTMHMLGHNFQERTWTVHQHEEVTCNLFALYAAETVLGCRWEELHPRLGNFPSVFFRRLSALGASAEQGPGGTDWLANVSRGSLAAESDDEEEPRGEEAPELSPLASPHRGGANAGRRRWPFRRGQPPPTTEEDEGEHAALLPQVRQSPSRRRQDSIASGASASENDDAGAMNDTAVMGSEEGDTAGDALLPATPSRALERRRRRPRNPFVNLALYQLLIRTLGWSALREVLREYGSLDLMELPRTDAARVDQLVHRFSRAAESDLAPLFDLWGIIADRSSVWYLRGALLGGEGPSGGERGRG